MVFCLFVLLYVYCVASRYLEGADIPGDGIDAIDRDDLLIGGVRKKLKEIGEQKLNSPATFSSLTTPTTSTEKIIADTTINITLKHFDEKKHLSIVVNSVTGFALGDALQEGLNHIRFHATLMPKKKHKYKSQFRSIKDLSISMSFGIPSVTTVDWKNSTLRLRLYGKRFEFGVPIGREKIIGETFVEISKLSLENEEEVTGAYAVLPSGTLFPRSDSEDFA